MTLKIPYFH